jgi:hypothetical protein
MQFNSDQKIDYIQKAIENFNLAFGQTTSPKAKETIQAQKEYYERQLELLNHKRNFRKEKIGKQQRAASDENAHPTSIDINERVVKATNIQLDLFKNIEASDIMIVELKKLIPDNSNFKTTDFQNLSSQFNDLFHQLITCVDETVSENEQLKERLRLLEDTKHDNVAAAASKPEDAAGEKEIQRDSDSSPEDLQELPPLDLPEFNLDSLGK